jgi:hypothetical protein
MRYVKWTFWGLIVLIVGSFLHYTLPQHDIVRISGVENRRIDFGENSIFWASPDVGTAAGTSRDVFFILAQRPNGRGMEYRNEDTGWIWPPYFKFNSFSLHNEAQNLISTAANPQWVVVTHYGWRIPFFTIFPNAVSVRPAEGPDQTIIPWVSIIVLVFLALAALMIRRMWMQFRERTLDPAIGAVDARADAASARARGLWGRWFGRKG